MADKIRLRLVTPSRLLLDEEVDEGAEAAWAEEIAKRIHDLDSGAVTPIPRSEARRRILER